MGKRIVSYTRKGHGISSNECLWGRYYEILESYRLPRVIVRIIGLFVEGSPKFFKTSLLKSLYFPRGRGDERYIDESRRKGRKYYPFSGNMDELEIVKWWTNYGFPAIMEGWKKKYPLKNPKLEINLGDRTLKTISILKDWSMAKAFYARNAKEGGIGESEEEKEEVFELYFGKAGILKSE